MNGITVGTTCRLKSGGPLLTVANITTTGLTLIYHQKGSALPQYIKDLSPLCVDIVSVSKETDKQEKYYDQVDVETPLLPPYPPIRKHP